MGNREARKAAVKVFLFAFAGFLGCVGAGYMLNGVTGAVWGIGVGIVFWIWLAS